MVSNAAESQEYAEKVPDTAGGYVVPAYTGLGAACLAGLAVGYWDSLEDVKNNWAVDQVFTFKMEEERRVKLLDGWHKAVRCALAWAEE